MVGRILNAGTTGLSNSTIIQWHFQRAFDLLKPELGPTHLRTLHAWRDLTGFIVRNGDISAGEAMFHSLQLTSKGLVAIAPRFRLQLARINVSMLRRLGRTDEALAFLLQAAPPEHGLNSAPKMPWYSEPS